ncbi:MAG: hypothetical protein NTV98_04315 [Candidatus Roizmanbacteria bacterium]|nr:hypothetical protein [Candidatus Roizmanbacteria bacterium]
MNSQVANLDSQYKPKNFSDSEISGIKGRLSTLKTSTAAAALAGATGTQAVELQTRAQRVADELDTIEKIESIAKGQSTMFKEYEKYTGAISGIEEQEKKLREFSKDEKEIVNKESERSKYSDKYKRKMEIALSEEMKRYWNEVSLVNAGKSADAQAAIKAEEKASEQKEKDTRVTKTKEMLDRFMQMSYLKYEKGEVKGWDDDAIKQFAKKDIFSRSPKQISRDIVDRIIRNRGKLPRAYGKEIDAMLKEMGVGKGEPPLAARDVLNSIEPSQYEKWAEEKMPDLMGYAWSRGYYFDRMKINPAKAEFLQRAYTEDFFANALAAKGQYTEEAAALLGGEFMSGGAITKEKIKEMLGKDWVGGTKKLMKALAYAGAGYALAGGLVFDANGAYLGLQKVSQSIGNVFRAGGAIAGSVSRAGDWAINAPALGIDKILSGSPAVTAGVGGPIITPAVPPFPPIRP